MDVRFWAATDVGRTRDHNEDNFLVDKKLNLFIGVPAVLGKGGVEKIIEMKLGDKEKDMLEVSAKAVRNVVKLLPYNNQAQS